MISPYLLYRFTKDSVNGQTETGRRLVMVKADDQEAGNDMVRVVLINTDFEHTPVMIVRPEEIELLQIEAPELGSTNGAMIERLTERYIELYESFLADPKFCDDAQGLAEHDIRMNQFVLEQVLKNLRSHVEEKEAQSAEHA
jgi:hypothetical protein